MQDTIRRLIAATALTVGLGATAAHATPSLSYEFFEDGHADGSMTATNGSITYTGSDSLFSFLQLGVSGVPVVPSPDLTTSTTSITTQSNFTGTHTITLEITQTGLTSPLGAFGLASTINLNNLTGPGVTSSISDYFDASNTAYGTATLIGSLNGIPGNNMTNGQTGQFTMVQSNGSNPYSETEILTATFTGAGQNLTTNNQINTPPTLVPEPASLALMGTGLIGLAAFGWRRRRG